MSRKTLLASAPLGLGALVLVWASMASRTEPERKPVRPAPKPAAAVPREAAAPAVEAAPKAADPAQAVALTGEYPAIEARIRLLEEKLVALEARKAELTVANQDLEREVSVKQAEQGARATAEWRVRQWEQLLTLTETQKQSLLEICMNWAREDAGRPASRDTWLRRESDLRARLSAEQSARLSESTSGQARQMWSHMGRSIASMAGAPKEDHVRLQQTLGDWRGPGSLLLPEAHGADWNGLMKEAMVRLQPLLSADQMAKLGRYVK